MTIAVDDYQGFLTAVNEVAFRHETVTLTRDGNPVAQLAPIATTSDDPILGFYKGKAEIVGDILSPLYSDEENEAFFEASAAQYK